MSGRPGGGGKPPPGRTRKSRWPLPANNRADRLPPPPPFFQHQFEDPFEETAAGPQDLGGGYQDSNGGIDLSGYEQYIPSSYQTYDDEGFPNNVRGGYSYCILAG